MFNVRNKYVELYKQKEKKNEEKPSGTYAKVLFVERNRFKTTNIHCH